MPAPYMAVNFTNTPMYNLIDILPATDKAGDKLIFKGYDLEGTVRDQFSIEKNTPE